MNLYYHKTSGGAEYLMDNFIICPNGEKEGTFKGSKYIVRIDGDITKDAELNINEDITEHENKERESIAEDKKVILNTPNYSVETKETDEGVIIDVFHRHGDLIDTYTYWNDDVMEAEE